MDDLLSSNTVIIVIHYIKCSPQVEKRFMSFGSGLSHIGIPSGQETFIGVYASNCVEVLNNCYNLLINVIHLVDYY